jgi:uncharacterized protein (DUF924 family)
MYTNQVSKNALNKGCLTRIILLDQFPRTVYKGSKNAFKFDIIALSITLEVLEKGWLQTEYTAMEIFSFLLVLAHSEDMKYQLLGLKHLKEMIESIRKNYPELANHFGRTALPSFMEHSNCVSKFGRFPSRNAALVSSFLIIMVYRYLRTVPNADA